jgi:transposase
MSKALSIDLRERVLSAVAAGATHREAAERFGVSAASVSRWRALEREQGDARPKALGGDRKSGRIDAHKNAIVEALGPEADRTIEEVRQALREQGLVFGFGSLQRFFKRHAITRKKRPPMRLSRTVPTS